LKDVVHSDNSLFLVFEHLDYDLRKYMKQVGPLSPAQVKVSVFMSLEFYISITSWY